MKIEDCYKVKNGIIVIVPVTDENTFNAGKNGKPAANLVITEYGLALFYKGHEIPIPEEMFDYITENNVVTLYEQKEGEYIHPVAATIEIGKNMLVEGRTIYKYEREKQKVNEKESANK